MEKVKIVVNRQISVVGEWVRKNRTEAIILVIVLLIGAFLRLYRIDEYMTFLGDEGRDVIVVRRLLVNFDPILVGPGTSIGNMYLGPIYYYMMAPFLLLANFSPVGPAIMIALLGVATIFLIWYMAREWFPTSSRLRGASGKVHIGALVAAGLYAISPTVIIHSRSSWNPNIMPFFAVLAIYSIWQFWFKKKFGWIVISGVSFAMILQSHYLGLLIAPVIGFYWLLTLKAISNKRQVTKKFISYTFYAAILFSVLMSPLVIFDARHGWRNFSSIHKFFTQRQTTVSARPWTALPKIWPITEKIVVRVVTGTNEIVGKILSQALVVLSIGVIISIYYKAKLKKDKSAKKRFSAYLLVIVWIIVALVGLGVYKQEIYDHYYGFFYAAPFFLIGGIFQEIYNLGRKKITFPMFFLLAIFLYFLVSVNLQNNPLKYPPNRQLQRTEEIAKRIDEEAGGIKYNIAVIAERNYEGAYQYFLENLNSPFVIIDPQRADETITDQLFVICELRHADCDPINHPKTEIANFGWVKIDNQWEVAGVLLFKLSHTQ